MHRLLFLRRPAGGVIGHDLPMVLLDTAALTVPKQSPQLAAANSVANRLSSVMVVHNMALSFATGDVEMAAK